MSPEDELEQRLRDLAALVDGPPDLVLAAARAALSTRDVDAELAELILDSLLDPGALAVRDGDDRGTRLLTFESELATVEVQVQPGRGPGEARRRSLTGLVVGAGTSVEVETTEGRREVPIDARGHFATDDVPAGAMRLHLVANGSRRVSTSWVTL